MAEKTSSSSSFASKMAAVVLITVNLVAMVFCAVLIALSLWSISSSRSLSSAIQTVGGNTLTALFPPESLSIQSGVGTVILATFVFIISFMGFYGALSRSQFLLFMYATLVLLLLMLECALIYYFTSNLVEKGVQEEDGQWAHYTRLAFKCCDFNSTKYHDLLQPPWSCCGADYYPNNCTFPDTFQRDCKPVIQSWLDRYETAIYTSLSVLHIILSSCSLLRRHGTSRSHS